MNKRLFEKLTFEMELKNYDKKSMRAYSDSIKRLEHHFAKKRLDKLSVDDFRRYIHHLLKEKKLSANTVNRHISAIRFFLRHVCNKHEYVVHLQNVKVPQRIPIFLTEEEMAHLIDSVHNLKYKAILMLAYSAGLRNSDVRWLKVQDIDSKRMVITIRQGKGKKDRQAVLSELALRCLRTYWRLHRLYSGVKSDFVFPPSKNTDGKFNKALSHSAIGYVIKVATQAAGIKKKSPPMSCVIRLPFISLNVA